MLIEKSGWRIIYGDKNSMLDNFLTDKKKYWSNKDVVLQYGAQYIMDRAY